MSIHASYKEKAENIYLCALNGNKTIHDIEHWRSIILEFQRIHTEILNSHIFLKMSRHCKKNVEAKMLDRILCYIEKECLIVLFNILKINKCFDYCKGDNVCSLIFDGLQPLDNNKIENY